MRFRLYILLLLTTVLLLYSCVSSSDKKVAEENQDESVGAIADLSQMIAEDSLNAALFEERARAYLEKKEHNLAMRDMLRAIELDPENHQYMLTLGDIYLSMGLLENCVEAIEKSLEIKPANKEAMLKLSELNIMMKKYEEAIKYADMALEQDKSDPLPHFMKGYTFAQAGDTLNAIKSYLETINLQQNHYDAYLELGLIYSTRNNPIAIDYFNNALNINPQSIEALYGLGMFYQGIDDAENAENAYNRILAIDPENKFAFYNLGYINLVILGDYRQAIEYFEQVEQLDPDYFEATFNKGYCYELLGDYELARQCYSNVLDKQVNYQKAIEGLNRIQGK
jgi:tetratricopeptide (TPR) repeat protein